MCELVPLTWIVVIVYSNGFHSVLEGNANSFR